MTAERETGSGPKGVSRRRLLGGMAVGAGAAWVTPAVFSSPAGATGPNGSCCGNANLKINTTTNSNGWTRTYTASEWSGSTPGVGVEPNYTSDCSPGLTPTANEGTGVFLVRDDPASGTETITVTASYCNDITLCAGVTYTFTFRVRSYGGNIRNQYLEVTVAYPAATGTPTPLVLQTAFSPNTQYNANNYANCQVNTLGPTFTPSTTGVHRFCFKHTLPPTGVGGSNVADDIGETGVIITCVP